MKKVILSLVALSLIGLLLTGCGRPKSVIRPSGGPHPASLNFWVVSVQNVYNPGEPVKLMVTIKNVSKKTLKIKSDPLVSVGPVMATPDTYTNLPVSGFKNQTLKPNQTIEQTVTWKQKGQTGWYNTQLEKIRFNYGELSGDGGQFFVSTPNVLLGTIRPDAALKNMPSDLNRHNAAFIITHIDFTKQFTKVYYEIKTDKKMTTDFQMSLKRSNGVTDPGALRAERKHIGSELTGVVYFNPTLKSVKQLSVILTKWNFATSNGVFSIPGKWKKTISIKDVN